MLNQYYYSIVRIALPSALFHFLWKEYAISCRIAARKGSEPGPLFGNSLARLFSVFLWFSQRSRHSSPSSQFANYLPFWPENQLFVITVVFGGQIREIKNPELFEVPGACETMFLASYMPMHTPESITTCIYCHARFKLNCLTQFDTWYVIVIEHTYLVLILCLKTLHKWTLLIRERFDFLHERSFSVRERLLSVFEWYYRAPDWLNLVLI